MTLKEPTHKEIMDFLDCCHYSRWHEGQCTCYTREQFKSCYESAKSQLALTEDTEEEIQKGRARNAKSMEAIKKALDELFG